MTVEVIDAATGAIRAMPLELGPESHTGEIRLELAPGASSVQVVVRDAGRVAAWIEVQAQAGEQVSVEFRCSPEGELRAFSRNREFLIFPNEEPGPRLLFSPPETQELDVVVLVDGTALHPVKTGDQGTPSLGFLLAPALADVWREQASRVSGLVSGLAAKYPKLWAMAAAFGDEPLPMLSNTQLKPGYLVFPAIPANRKLEPCTVTQLLSQMRALPPTSGGDFVDGLADGLQACGQARWRQNSRKLLIVFGQSPGYSVYDTNDDMTNLLARKACVEEEVAALHRRGVEIISILHDPQAAELYSTEMPGVFERTRLQYKSLASLSEWSGTSADFDPAQIANSWLNPPVVLARGPSPGLLVP